MHEYSIVQALVDRVEAEMREHGASAVHQIRVRIGRQAGVEIELLEAAYDLFRAGTVCENAGMEVVPVEIQWSCPDCDQDIGTDGPLRCSACGVAAKLAAGDEIVLDRLELEVA